LGGLRFSSGFPTVLVRYFARPNFACGRLLINSKTNGEPIRDLDIRWKTKTQFVHREIKTPNRVLKPENPCYFSKLQFCK
jgi:hypothetical protein